MLVQAQNKKATLVPTYLSVRVQEMVEHAQGNCGTREGDVNPENAKVLQEHASNLGPSPISKDLCHWNKPRCVADARLTCLEMGGTADSEQQS